MRHDRLTWLAVVHGDIGYVLDAYPQECVKYRQELGKRIIGEYRSADEAALAISRNMRRSTREG